VDEAVSVPTLVGVAAAAGVSRATASRALGGYGRVGAKTVAHVQKIADELGYLPNQMARAMRQGRSKTLGLVIISNFTNAYFDRATKAIVDAADEAGFQVLVSNTAENLVAERQAVTHLLEKQVDGLIVVPVPVGDHAHLLPAALRNTPVVLFDREAVGISASTFTTDDFTSCAAAIEYAASLGHRHVGCLVRVAGIPNVTAVQPAGIISSIMSRINGIKQGAAAAGLSASDVQWRFVPASLEVAQSGVEQMLDSPNPPTFIFTSNNDMLLAVLAVAQKRGLIIGHDLSLITVDDSPWAAVLGGGLSVVARPVEQLAQAAVAALLQQIDEPDRPIHNVVLPTELVIRKSVVDLKA
jgi:LacI family transcriptional regulator